LSIRDALTQFAVLQPTMTSDIRKVVNTAPRSRPCREANGSAAPRAPHNITGRARPSEARPARRADARRYRVCRKAHGSAAECAGTCRSMFGQNSVAASATAGYRLGVQHWPREVTMYRNDDVETSF